jgi:hypothetical protein
MIHRVFRVADTLNQTLQAKSKTINEILTQATVCILNLERKKSTYQNFFNKIVDRAQSLGINAPEKMLLDENERAAKKVVLAVSAQSKRKKSGPVMTRKQVLSTAQVLNEITDVAVEYNIYEKMYNESFNLYIRYIQERFDNNKLKPLVAIYDLICDEICLFDFKKSLEIYCNVIDFVKLKSEMLTFYEFKKIEKLKSLDDIVNFFRKSEFVRTTYTQIVILIKIYLSCGLVSVECERGFSCMDRVKSAMRTTMSQFRLTSLAVLNFNSDFINSIDLEQCIDIFNSQYKRKVTFA